MTKNAQEVLQVALALDEAERAEIVAALLSSLEPADVGVEEAWREEIRRRVAEIDAGEVELVPWETVRKDLFARLNDQS
jgi:putative addiction module component (TIGR02574 family)